MSRPYSIFGPPLVESHRPGERELCVCAHEPASAVRPVPDEGLAATAANNLVAPYDRIRADANGRRIVRSLDDRPVRLRSNMPRIARDKIELTGPRANTPGV